LLAVEKLSHHKLRECRNIIMEMGMRGSLKYNALAIVVLLVLIIGVGVWGHLFEPLELTTCTARGGQIAGDYGSGAV
jgi:hypothetical protein